MGQGGGEREAEGKDPGEAAPAAAVVCARCHSPEVEPGYAVALCAPCRDLLARRPFPTWIAACGAAAVLTALVCSVLAIPSFRAGSQFERGRDAEKRGDFAAAASHYRQVVDRFPDSTKALARWGIAAARAGRLDDAAIAFRRLSGRKLPRELAEEVNQTMDALDAAAARPGGDPP